MDISKFLQMMMQKGASDMFITPGAPIQLKVEGTMYPLGEAPLPSEATRLIAEKLMSQAQRAAAGDPRHQDHHSDDGGVASSAGVARHHHVQARPGSRRGRDRIRQVHDPGLHD